MQFSGTGFRAWSFAGRDLPIGLDGPDVDIHVELADGSHYVGTVYTLDRIRVLMDELRSACSNANGSYFHDTSMIIVASMDRQIIIRAIEDLVASGQIRRVFELAASSANEII